MKKKYVIRYTMLVLTIITAGVGAVSATNSWGKYKKDKGILRQQNGTTVSVPTEKDKIDIINSIDPKSGLPLKKLERNLKDHLIQTKIIKLNEVGVNKDIPISYVKKGEKNIIIHEGGVATYLFTPIPYSNNYLVEINQSIYLMDIGNSNITRFLKDSVSDYDIDKVMKGNKEGTYLWWGANPSVNPGGTKMIFYTNRSFKKNESQSDEIWYKDLTSGKEKFLRKGAYSALGWDSNDNVYLQEANSLTKLNVNTSEYKVIKENAPIAAYAHPYLIYQSQFESVNIFDVEKNTEKIVKDKAINIINSIEGNTDNNSPWVALLNQPDRIKALTNLVFINLNTYEIRSLTSPEDFFIQDYSWQDTDNLMINIRYKGSQNEETYIVNINDL